MTRPLVLVVDDHPLNTKLVSFVVRSRGMDVVTAASAVEAREALARALPALILMDVQLPEVDGLTLTRELRTDTRYATVPIVAVTAYAMERDRLAAIDAGCDAFVSKPIDTQALGDLVRDLVANGRAGV
ncbi:MAG: response regulator [Deltaproteobacteria bacterium]|nr:response regulator [Deltaproteobacteria bacterium]